jgi:hypothetical protein
MMTFDLANESDKPLFLIVRVDDDPSADGKNHTHYVNFNLSAGEKGSYSISFFSDPLKDKGMTSAPPNPLAPHAHSVNGYGSIDVHHIYAVSFGTHNPPEQQTVAVSNFRLLPQSPSETYRGIVDRYGQWTGADWPGKAHGDIDLINEKTRERADLAAHPAPADRDAYGGWANGPKLTPTGYFRTAEQDGRWWLVTPGGHLFLSFGIASVTPGETVMVESREEMFQWLPAEGDPLAKHFSTTSGVFRGPIKSGKTFNFYQANLERKFGSNDLRDWRTETISRLLSWGFNTLGNWSDLKLEAMDRIPYTAALAVGGDHARVSSGSDWWGKMHDPFDPQFAADCATSFAKITEADKNDPWCIGYFVDNELSWSGGNVSGGRYGLAYGALNLPSTSPAKHAFIEELRAKYKEVSELNAAWGTSFGSWADLDAPFKASDKPNEAQKEDMGHFVHAFAARYFIIVLDTLKKLDPNHLYLGCRFSNYTPEVVSAAAAACDVVSFNIYRKALSDSEWGFTRDLHKPCIVGEFQFGALDRGGFDPGAVSAADETERAALFEKYVNSVVANPVFVGAHWFEYVDMPVVGRTFDSENQAIGFVSINDTPYPELVQAARSTLAHIYPRSVSRR